MIAYNKVVELFHKERPWDVMNSGKLKLIEYMQWKDIPEYFSKNIRMSKGNWDYLLNFEHLLNDDILTDIKEEYSSIQSLVKSEFDQEVLTMRLPKIYVLMCMLGKGPKKSIEVAVRRGDLEHAMTVLERWFEEIKSKRSK